MVALGVRIGDMRAADLLDFFKDDRVGQGGPTQFLPIPALAARDHIVNGRQTQLLMIKMPVDHVCGQVFSPVFRLCSMNSFCKSASDFDWEVPSTVFSAMSWTF